MKLLIASSYGLCSLAREQPQAWKLLPDIDDANLKAELAQRLRTTNVLGEEEESAPTIQETNLGTSAPTRGEGRRREKEEEEQVANVPLDIEIQRGHHHFGISFGSRRGKKAKTLERSFMLHRPLPHPHLTFPTLTAWRYISLLLHSGFTRKALLQ